MKKSTLSDVAERTGLSVTTISRVLNGKAEVYRISEASKNLVLKTVKDLDYKPNVLAQNLRNSSSRTIGLLVPGIDNPFFANVANAVINEAHKFGYPVMLIDTHESVADEDEALDIMTARNIDGVIMVPTCDNPSSLEKYARDKPLVLIDRYFTNSTLPYVATDNFRGAYDATKLLLDAGHTHIMCIQGTTQSVSSRLRVKGFLDALHSIGAEGNGIVCGNDFSVQNGYLETKLALTSHKKFTAIFALSNTILLGAIRAITEQGLRVPEDVSLVSFDDNLYLDFLHPPVTRVAQPIEDISIVAVKMLMDKLRNADAQDATLQPNRRGEPTGILLPSHIIYRSSIAPCHRL